MPDFKRPLSYDKTVPKYNTSCPGHRHFCWGHRHLMREDDLVCTVCYKRLPKDMQQKLWRYKYSDFPVSSGDYSIVTDWLLDHELAEDLTCPDREEQMSEFRLEDLQDEVAKILIGNYDYDANEAEEAIREACSDEPEMWNENADASELAKHVADPEDDE